MAVVVACPSAVILGGESDTLTVLPSVSSALTRRPMSLPSGVAGVPTAGTWSQYSEVEPFGPMPTKAHGLGWSGVPLQLAPLMSSIPMYWPFLIGRSVLNTYGVWLGPQKLLDVTQGSSGVSALFWTTWN